MELGQAVHVLEMEGLRFMQRSSFSLKVIALTSQRQKQGACLSRQKLSKIEVNNNVHPMKGSGSYVKVKCSAETASVSFIQEFEERASADEVRREILRCYKLIKELGKGVVYLGSSRILPNHPHFMQAMELGKEVSLLLNCTSWTGVGPGLMDAAIKGAMLASKPVGGFKISREGGEWTSSNVHPYLNDQVYFTCRFFSARKHGLVDAAVRDHLSDQTAFIALPGGIGTLDEIFEILSLIQLGRLGSRYPVPFLLMNYDGFYDHLLSFLATCKASGTVAEGEVDSLWHICNTNADALDYLARFYKLQEGEKMCQG